MTESQEDQSLAQRGGLSFSAVRDVAVAGGLVFTAGLWVAHMPFYDELGIAPGDVGLSFGDVLERSIGGLLSLMLLTPVLAYALAILALVVIWPLRLIT